MVINQNSLIPIGAGSRPRWISQYLTPHLAAYFPGKRDLQTCTARTGFSNFSEEVKGRLPLSYNKPSVGRDVFVNTTFTVEFLIRAKVWDLWQGGLIFLLHTTASASILCRHCTAWQKTCSTVVQTLLKTAAPKPQTYRHRLWQDKKVLCLVHCISATKAGKEGQFTYFSVSNIYRQLQHRGIALPLASGCLCRSGFCDTEARDRPHRRGEEYISTQQAKDCPSASSIDQVPNWVPFNLQEKCVGEGIL